MNFLRNLRIAPKLVAAFSVVLACMAGLGGFAIWELGRVNQTSTDMAENWMPSVRVTLDMNTNTSDFRIAELQHVVSQDPENMTRYEKELDGVLTAFNRNAAEYEKLISSPEERALWDSFKGQWSRYLEMHKQVLALSRANKTEEVLALMRGDSQKVFDESSATLLKLGDLNVKGGQQASRDGDAMFASARAWIVGVMLLAIAIGLVLAVWIARAISTRINLALTVAQTVAKGDLTSRIEVSTSDETGLLLAALKTMNTNLVGIVSNVRLSSESIATGSTQIAMGNNDLSQRTEEQASNLEQTAASMEELTATVKQNADTARQATQLAASASEAAAQGGAVVGQVVGTMQDISASSQKINDIIGVIDGIAFQTNILALNAAVEAARAGEQGRGFAVVAAEVRNLAQRSAEAAKEIKGLISTSVDKVEAGTRLVDEAGRSMDDIVQQVQRVSHLIAEISAASAEQSSGIAQVGNAVAQLDQVTQQNAALVEESAAAADSLKSQAARLIDVVSVFRLDGAAAVSVAAQPATRSPVVRPAAVPVPPVAKPVAVAPAVYTPPSPAPARAASPLPTPAPAPAKTPVAAGAEGDWESF